jgi:hypothetical protein
MFKFHEYEHPRIEGSIFKSNFSKEPMRKVAWMKSSACQSQISPCQTLNICTRLGDDSVKFEGYRMMESL